MRTFMVFIGSAHFQPTVKTLSRLRFHRTPCFCRRLRQSAIMAMNSEFVGLPFIFDTV